MRHILLIAACCLSLSVLSPLRAEGEDTNRPQETDRDKAVMAVLDSFMSTFNSQDIEAHLATYHFPHVRLAGGQVSVMMSPDEYPRDLYESRLIPSGWHHSAWIERKIVQGGADKVHVATTFRRFREDGSTLATYQSLYVVEKVDGKWAIRARSSFAP